MLKIRDDVDLKELEKFGFEKVQEDDGYYYTKQYFVKDMSFNYWINEETRIIELENNYIFIKLDNTLYDLIQAGLVEKIEE